ncbi:MAG: cation-translocating P-type ATPase [Deltaproteobacteria bacterium]|nr:cation-translocating P-type ATPase [Deltaproteobacteria bacterium]
MKALAWRSALAVLLLGAIFPLTVERMEHVTDTAWTYLWDGPSLLAELALASLVLFGCGWPFVKRARHAPSATALGAALVAWACAAVKLARHAPFVPSEDVYAQTCALIGACLLLARLLERFFLERFGDAPVDSRPLPPWLVPGLFGVALVSAVVHGLLALAKPFDHAALHMIAVLATASPAALLAATAFPLAAVCRSGVFAPANLAGPLLRELARAETLAIDGDAGGEAGAPAGPVSPSAVVCLPGVDEQELRRLHADTSPRLALASRQAIERAADSAEAGALITRADDLRQRGLTVSYVLVDGKPAAVVGFGGFGEHGAEDSTRASLEPLRASGLKLILLTGANRVTAAARAAHLGLDTVTELRAELTPEQKQAALAELAAASPRLVVVRGASIELGGGLAPLDLADATPETLARAHRLARLATDVERLGTALAWSYNALGVVAAAAFTLRPSLGALASLGCTAALAALSLTLRKK